MRLSAMPRPTLFQFHKGTIRTFRNDAGPDSVVDFNSIKVRLELTPAALYLNSYS